MARRPRIYIPGVAHHVIQRGNNREACFGDDSDYKAYLTYLKEGSAQYGVAIHAFVLRRIQHLSAPLVLFKKTSFGAR